ncbi:Galactitol utilization operon repressor [Klebsiella michiganensis]|nr:Galactitol utilization operon repressor [Klebsiella michiganensis]
MEKINCVITDSEINEEHRKALKSTGIELHIV